MVGCHTNSSGAMGLKHLYYGLVGHMPLARGGKAAVKCYAVVVHIGAALGKCFCGSVGAHSVAA